MACSIYYVNVLCTCLPACLQHASYYYFLTPIYVFAGPGPAADTAASTHNAAPHSQHPRGLADWSDSSSSAFASVSAQPAPATTNAPPVPYNLSQSYALWSHYMLNKNAVPYSSYPAPHEENPHPLRHTHIPPDKDSGMQSFHIREQPNKARPAICFHSFQHHRHR